MSDERGRYCCVEKRNRVICERVRREAFSDVRCLEHVLMWFSIKGVRPVWQLKRAEAVKNGTMIRLLVHVDPLFLELLDRTKYTLEAEIENAFSNGLLGLPSTELISVCVVEKPMPVLGCIEMRGEEEDE